ncbi:hypothetical protein ACE1SV_68820 [Streptomyces sp. E-15]
MSTEAVFVPPGPPAPPNADRSELFTPSGDLNGSFVDNDLTASASPSDGATSALPPPPVSGLLSMAPAAPARNASPRSWSAPIAALTATPPTTPAAPPIAVRPISEFANFGTKCEATPENAPKTAPPIAPPNAILPTALASKCLRVPFRISIP